MYVDAVQFGYPPFYVDPQEYHADNKILGKVKKGFDPRTRPSTALLVTMFHFRRGESSQIAEIKTSLRDLPLRNFLYNMCRIA